MNPSTSRIFPIASLIGMIVVAGLLSSLLMDQNQLPLFLLLALIGLMFWIYLMGGGWRSADDDTTVIVKDMTHTARAYSSGSYLYIPGINTIAAKMPTYPINHEFSVDAIDTRTPKIQKIQKIMVRVNFTITDPEVCYDKSSELKQQIRSLEQSEKLKPDNPTLWVKVLGRRMEALIARTIRKAVWEWVDNVAQNPALQLQTHFARNNDTENDPYALSLNRDKLLQQVMDRVVGEAQNFGVRVRGLTFANIEIDQSIIDRATRSKPGELNEAKHQAEKESAAIREKGMVEAEVRAATVTKIIEALLNQQQIPITDQLIVSIVRAAMYSDGEMIWQGVIERGSAVNVKAA